jgi:hypothetical protein
MRGGTPVCRPEPCWKCIGGAASCFWSEIALFFHGHSDDALAMAQELGGPPTFKFLVLIMLAKQRGCTKMFPKQRWKCLGAESHF